jgi:hypothetical protein
MLRPDTQAPHAHAVAGLDDHQPLGSRLAKTKGTTLKVDARLPADLVRQIQACATQSGVCKTDIIRTWLEAGSKATGWSPSSTLDGNGVDKPRAETHAIALTPARRKAPIRQRAYTPTDPALVASVAIVGNLLESVLDTLLRVERTDGVVEMTMALLVLHSIERMASEALAPLNRRSIEKIKAELPRHSAEERLQDGIFNDASGAGCSPRQQPEAPESIGRAIAGKKSSC